MTGSSPASAAARYLSRVKPGCTGRLHGFVSAFPAAKLRLFPRRHFQAHQWTRTGLYRHSRRPIDRDILYDARIDIGLPYACDLSHRVRLERSGQVASCRVVRYAVGSFGIKHGIDLYG